MTTDKKVIAASVLMIIIFALMGIFTMIATPEGQFPAREFFWGQLPGALNYVLGVVAIKYASVKDDRNFMVIVLGTMTLSTVFTAIFIIFLLHILNLSQKYYIITVFIFYFLYLTLQLIYLVKSEKKTLPKDVH
jgi:hypothetical protein